MDEKTPLDDLPGYWRQQIKNLRAENARVRIERNELQAECDALRSELGTLKAAAAVRTPGRRLDDLVDDESMRQFEEWALQQRNAAAAEAEFIAAGGEL